jgi:hypothetical protein
MQMALNDSENLEYWGRLIRPLVRRRPVNLFTTTSDLVMLLLLYILTGTDFAEKHAKEVVPMMQPYARLRKHESYVLGRRISPTGRLLDGVERRMKMLIEEEVAFRLKNMERFRHKRDYLQIVLNRVGGKFVAGICPIDGSLIHTAYPGHIVGLLDQGHANQTTTFAWSLVHAIRSPLLSALRQPGSKDLLEATLHETGRLYSNLMLVRGTTRSQTILGKDIPKGAYIACSPLITGRDPDIFLEPNKFRPQRWMTPEQKLDEARLKNAQRLGTWNQFGKGQFACVGVKLARLILLDTIWSTILGNDAGPGFDVQIMSGIKEGIGIDDVGVEAKWSEAYLGTPFEKGDPVMVRFKLKSAP